MNTSLATTTQNPEDIGNNDASKPQAETPKPILELVADTASDTRAKTEDVLDESEDGIIDRTQELLEAVRDIEGGITTVEYRDYCTHAAEIMDQYVTDGILIKNDKGRYEGNRGYEEAGKIFVGNFVTVLGELKKKKKLGAQQAEPAKTAEEPKQKTEAKKPALESEDKPVDPLAIEIDGKTFTPSEATVYANRLKTGADDFRTRYFAKLEERIVKVNGLIGDAIAQIEKAERIATKGDQTGVVAIMKTFVEQEIARRNDNGSYRGNPEIKRAEDLVRAANKQIRTINSQLLERNRKTREEHDAREQAYDSIIESDTGFERTVVNQATGREVAKFAYQIRLEEKLGKTIIIVEKVVVRFGNVQLREGNQFLYGDGSTPRFVNNAAEKILRKKSKAHHLATVGEAVKKREEEKK